MKKTLLTGLSALAAVFAFAQTATNWTANDCSGNAHTLFTELNAGKVVVLTWPMPCGACITPSKTASNTVVGMSNPNVVYYLVDDAGNTSCSSLNSWASTNAITTTATFGNAGNTIKMTDYGTAGMPKTIVVGGPNHTVFYNVNGTVSASALQTAINNALNSMTAVNEIDNVTGLNIYPNPASASTNLSYSLISASDVTINVFNVVGAQVKTAFSGKQAAGEYTMELDCSSLNTGIYFVKIGTGKLEKTIMLSINH